MPATVEVRFKGNRRDYYLWGEDAQPLKLQDPVIVEAERGLDFGRVSAVGDTAAAKCAGSCSGCAVGEPPKAILRVVRRATPVETRTAEDIRRSEEDIRRKVIVQVQHYSLDMKVSDAEWQWDHKKLTVYFTAETRVDFRTLVRDLAKQFRTRIDLRQIGVRDEAARIGGVGRCGREYCCSTWLTSLGPVSLSLAKDQHLSLNPAQISGGCGRLLCCLKYEHEFYVTARKRFPKEGKLLRTGLGMERVVAVDIFRERVFLRHDEEGPRTIPLLQLRDEQALVGTEPLPPVQGTPPPSSPPRGRSTRPERGDRSAPPPAPRPSPSAPPPPSAVPSPEAGAPTADSPKRKRRRRRRGRGSEGGGDSNPSAPTNPGG